MRARTSKSAGIQGCETVTANPRGFAVYESILCAMACFGVWIPPISGGERLHVDESSGPPQGHPERLVPTMRPTRTERKLWAQLRPMRGGSV
ncbi:DUF6059 family protein [Actinospica acidithermotolerans]|uniref:DUF6059 family protein n=1 Tax=Actinospica acidithermotolerans TaxID=2828514 RepID=UPI0035589EEF